MTDRQTDMERPLRHSSPTPGHEEHLKIKYSKTFTELCPNSMFGRMGIFIVFSIFITLLFDLY
jgi:MarR-like DNA-binding transcriptional regulator SgrR of sgrS sRNA